MKNPIAFNSNALKSATALESLCFILAVATLLLTVQGQEVMAAGIRRWVDSHWLELGERVFASRLATISQLGHPETAPAIASKKRAQQQFEMEFTVKSYQFAA